MRNATSADLVAAALDMEPKLAAGTYQNQICGALVDDAGNAPYLAAAEAVAAAAGSTEQLEVHTPKPLALRLLLERMEASVELANDQTRASLAVMLPSDYRDCIMVGFRFQPSFSSEQSKSMAGRINESFRDIDPLPGLPQTAVAALAGQDFLNACLCIDPSTGEVEPEGLCNAAKVRMKVDRRTTAGSLQVNEEGRVKGALRRAARFKKMIEERVAQNADERKVLAWLHEDPICRQVARGLALDGQVGGEGGKR